MSSVSNVFIECHTSQYRTEQRRFGTGWENLFTEQFAFFLSADLPAAAAVARMLLSRADVEVRNISTQVASDVGTPDLLIECTDGSRLYVEHKFDSPLGTAQLERYSTLGPVALVSRCSQSVPLELLSLPSYCRPAGRDYFHWGDVYSALPHAADAPAGFGGLRDHFKGYMRELGLAPSSLTSDWRRLFEERTDPENQRTQKEFGRRLDSVKASLRSRGFRVQDMSHYAKQAYSLPGASWRHLYVRPDRVRADYLDALDCAPFEPGYEGVVVEFVFDSANTATVQFVHDALSARRTELANHGWYVVRPRPIGHDRTRLPLATPLAPFLIQQDFSDALSASAWWAIDQILTTIGQSSAASVLGA